MVSNSFPLSPSAPPHLSRQSRESRDTSLFSSHFTSPPSSVIYPNHLPFGDSLPVPKLDSHFWIGFCNIGGFLAIAGHNDKVLDVKSFLVAHNLDIFGRCKSNLNWQALPDHIQLQEWFRSADGCRTFHAHNLHENFGSFQYGGTFWIAAGHATTQISALECDPSKLGCWVSCSLMSCLGKKLIIIFTYRPCANTANWIRSVVAQHRWFFATTNHYCCLRDAFLSDLGTFIHTHQDAGDSIILLGDMNGNIHHPSLHAFAMAHHLQETILSRFPSLLPPATFQCSSWSGSTPIDGTWISADIHVSAAQWCPIQLSPGDHRVMILDVNLTECIGEPRYTIVRPPGR